MQNPAIHPTLSRLLKRKEGNCFLWGCVTLVVVFILGSIVAFLTIRYGIGQLRERYTDDTPIELPIIEMPRDDVDALIRRVDEFARGLRADDALEPLTLTQDELNALLRNHPEAEKWGEYVYFTIEEDDSLTGQVSVPLDFLPGFGGRYFNGSVGFEVAIENGEFTVFVNSATLNGEPVPANLMQEIRGENIANDINKNSEAQELIDKLESLMVVDGVIRITPIKTEGKAVEEEPLGEKTANRAPEPGGRRNDFSSPGLHLRLRR